MRSVNGKQYSSYRERCCAMGLLADYAEWMRCSRNEFASTFDPLPAVFATIIALCEASSPFVLFELNIANIPEDLVSRYIAFPDASKVSWISKGKTSTQCKQCRMFWKYTNYRLNVEDSGSTKPANGFQTLPHIQSDTMKIEEQLHEEVSLAIKSFRDSLKAVFNSPVDEILSGVTADQLFASRYCIEPIERTIRQIMNDGQLPFDREWFSFSCDLR